MILEKLSENIRKEDEIAEEIHKLNYKRDEKRILALKKQLAKINNSLPSLIKDIEVIKSLSRGKEKTVKAEKKTIKEEPMDAIKPSKGRNFIKIANKLFSDISNSLVEKGNFKKLNEDLRKANMRMLLNTYVSVMLFSTLLSFFLACIIYFLAAFFNFSLSTPFISMAEDVGMRLVERLWIFIIPIATYFIFYTYPGSEAGSIAKRIQQELPFVAINMSAIASSGLSPDKIFKIMVKSGDEYPSIKAEFEKVLSYVDIYGEDITTALKTAAGRTSSKSLRELFDGLANSIISGSSLTNFLDKRAESLLFEYRLERERYTKLAETFMNIYISVVIAAPLVLMLTFFLMSMGGLGAGIGLDAISLLIVLGVILINVFFLIFLHFKQPSY